MAKRTGPGSKKEGSFRLCYELTQIIASQCDAKLPERNASSLVRLKTLTKRTGVTGGSFQRLKISLPLISTRLDRIWVWTNGLMRNTLENRNHSISGLYYKSI